MRFATFATALLLATCNGHQAGRVLYRDEVLSLSKRPAPSDDVQISPRQDLEESSSVRSSSDPGNEESEETHLQVIPDESNETRDQNGDGSLEQRGFPWELIFGTKSKSIKPIITILSFGVGMLAVLFLIESPLSPLPVPPLPFPPVGPNPPLGIFNYGVHPVKEGFSLFANRYGSHRLGRNMDNFTVELETLPSPESFPSTPGNSHELGDEAPSPSESESFSWTETNPESPDFQDAPDESLKVPKCDETQPHCVKVS